jgi:hypothetical protein
MDLDRWYRCTVCGYMYTPLQVLALMQLLTSRSGQDPELPSDAVLCRRKGCTGTLAPTDEPYVPPHR